ncbi:MAG: S9 family peptidase [Thermoprotei archaeon]
MSIELSRIASLLEKLVKIPTYTVLGYTSDYLVYVSNKSGVTSIWLYDTKTGHEVEAIRGPVSGVFRIRFEKPYIIYTRDVARGREQHKVYIYSATSKSTIELSMEPMRVFSGALDEDRIVFTGATMKDISLYMAKLDGSVEKLAVLNKIVLATDINRNYIVGYGYLRGDPRSTELFIYDLSSNEYKIYTLKPGTTNTYPLFKPGTNRIVFRSDYEGTQKLYYYDIDEDKLEELVYSYKDIYDYKPVEISGYDWSDQGKLWVIGSREGRSKLFLDGREVKSPTGTISGAVVVGDYAYFSHSSLVEPPKIYRASIVNSSLEVLIDNPLSSDIREAIGEREHVWYKSRDGLDIPMYIIYSRQAGKPGPTVVYIHGGPWSLVSDSWRTSIAALVASGYHVLAPNFRGSTGYGEEFRKLDIGDPGGGDLWDIVYAREYGIEKGIVDPGRVAVMGYSYGGYMTLLALGKHPDLWRCGVAGASVVDWEEMYSLSDALFREFIDTLFDKKHELFRERSPITYAENIKAPLCIIHPQNDTRTPLKPVLKLMDKLLASGKSFEAHIAPDMGHVINTIEDAIKILLPALLFLEKHLKQ